MHMLCLLTFCPHCLDSTVISDIVPQWDQRSHIRRQYMYSIEHVKNGIVCRTSIGMPRTTTQNLLCILSKKLYL
jgi:hypothetical protein